MMHQVNMIISEHDAQSTSIAKLCILHGLLQTALGIVKLPKHQLMLNYTSSTFCSSVRFTMARSRMLPAGL